MQGPSAPGRPPPAQPPPARREASRTTGGTVGDRRRPGRRPGLAVAAAVGTVWLAAMSIGACGQRPALSDVSVTPATITPDRDGVDDVAAVRYRVGEPVTVTIALVSPNGATYDFRSEKPRSPGSYEALFGGVVDGQMVPPGNYTLRISARRRNAPDAAPATVEVPFAVHGGDDTPPELVGFTVQPQVFTPNQDGLDDRVSISYRLDERATVRVWLERPDGSYVTDILAEQQGADDPGEPGPHVYEYDAGVDADAPPPPDGSYVIAAEARDETGNIGSARAPLEIRDGGQPRAALLGDVQWSTTTVPLGGTLWFTVTVANLGRTPIRTRGPEPGFVYDNNQTFNQPAADAVLILARSETGSASRMIDMRAADPIAADIDLASARSSHAADTAAVAAPLEPGSNDSGGSPADTPRKVCGTVRDGGRPVARAEVYAFESDGDNGARTTADDAGRFCFDGLVVPPEHERTYARSPGAIRLGLEYDEVRTDLEYPYRWQLGATADLSVCEGADRLYLCLAPGQTVAVTGGVRFVEPPFRRSTLAYLALLHEDVRRMHGPYGEQRLTIEY